MFRLARFFAITSLVVLILVAAAMGWLFRRYAIDDLMRLERNKGLALGQSFSNTFWPDFLAFLEETHGLSADELAAHPKTVELRHAILAQMTGTGVVRVKIYDLYGRTVFSTDEGQIGEDQRNNPGFVAARNGEIVGELIYSNRFNQFDHIVEERDVLGTYVPIRRAGSAQVEGVFELYTDVSSLLDAIDTQLWNIVLMVGAVFTALYIVLFSIVRIAESILLTQYRERLRAEKDLHERVETEQLVGTISAVLANSMPENIDAGVEAALAQLGVTVGADFAVFYHFDPTAAEIDKRFVWSASNDAQRSVAPSTSPKDFSWLLGELAAHGTLVIDDLATLPASAAAEQAFFRSLDARHVWICPIVQVNQTVGFLGLVTSRPEWATPQHMFGLTTIVTDVFSSALARQRAAADLLATQQQLTHLISSSPLIIYSRKPEAPWSPTFVSDTIERMLGYTPQQVLAERAFWETHIHPNDLPRLEEADAQLAHEGRRLVEYRIRHANGDWRWLRDEARLVRNAAEQPSEVVGSWIDITETRHVEATLTQSETRFATLVQSMQDTVFTVAATGRYSSVYGRTSGEGHVLRDRIVGLLPREAWDAVTAETHHAAIQQALRGEPVIFEWSAQEDGRDDITHFQTSLSPVRDGQGTVSGLVGVSRDISNLKRLEQVKSDFVANVSHELRTPLASILGYAETLLRGRPGALTAVQQEFLQTILASARRLKTLVDDLLDVSRLESGRFSLSMDVVDLNRLIRRAVDTIKPLAEKASIDIIVSMPGGIPVIEGDPHRIEQVLDNLLSNAVKFSEPGDSVTLTIAEEADFLCLTVADTGVGIPSEDLQDLFSRFHRARNVSQDTTGGAGLGLYITKVIVEGHGGQIEVESIVNQGATFRVRLPYMQTAPADIPSN